MAGTDGVPALNLKQVARLLDVHYMTVYRYVRSGRLPAHRDGSAWLVDPADLERFQRLGDVAPDQASQATGPADVAAAVDRVQRLRERLVVGDEVGAWTEVETALVAGWDPESVIVDLVSEAVRRTGPADGVAAAHLAVTAAARTIAGVSARFRRPGRSRGTVVLGAPDGEGHTFGLTVIADVLRLRNVHVLDLGSRVPSGAFVEAAAMAERLVAVGIGVTSADHLDAARSVVDLMGAASPSTPVLVGGQAVANPEVAALTGATAWAADARGMADLVEAHLPARRATREVSRPRS